MDVYLIPGLGTDVRLFSRLDLGGYRTTVLEWPVYPAGITLPTLARDMAAQVDKQRPHVLVGVSMGGMLAQELALLTAPQRVVLISSITGPREMPPLLHLSRRTGLHHLITDATVRWSWPLRRHFGVQDKAIARLLCDMAFEQGGTQIRRGTEAIVHWSGAQWTGPLQRIHGDRDRVLPLRFPVDAVVHGGTHPMIITHGAQVSRMLRELLGREVAERPMPNAVHARQG